MRNKRPKRLILEAGDELHAQVKESADKRNIPMSQWLLRAVLERLRKEQVIE